MHTAGIICEYNPFHAGHKKQLDLLHSMGYDCVVCIMSGNYTQRGEFAIFDKYTRASSAVHGGADIVLELPFPYSSFSAEGFAFSGVHMLSSLGVDAICFGSECADLSTLSDAADAVNSSEFPPLYSSMLKSGLGSAAAYFETVKTILNRDIPISSNDILGISYIAAIKKSNIKMTVIPIKRDGADYRETRLLSGTLPSASAIREHLKKDGTVLETDFTEHIPELSLFSLSNAKKEGLGPVLSSNVGAEILSFFKLMSPDEITKRAIARSGGGTSVAEDGFGICSRLCNTSVQCSSLDEMLRSAYTSKFTNARINRVVLFSLFGVSDSLTHSTPEYATLLSANSIGRKYLSLIRKSSDFSIVTKPADAPQNSIQRRICETADQFYAQAMPSATDGGYFVKSHPIMIK